MIDASVAKPAFEYAYRDPDGDYGDNRYSDCSIKSGLQFCSGIVGYHGASCGKPAVCVSKWRIRIGSQLPGAPGRYFFTGSSTPIRPSCTSSMMPAAVNCLVIESKKKIVAGCADSSRSFASPNARAVTTLPSRTTDIATPTIRRLRISFSMREFSCASGFASEEDCASAVGTKVRQTISRQAIRVNNKVFGMVRSRIIGK